MKLLSTAIFTLLLLASAGFAEALPSSALEAPILTSVVAGDSYCKMEWNEAENVSGYNVYLKKEDGSFVPLNSVPIKNEWILVNDLTNGEPYQFGITSIGNDRHESAVTITGLVVPTGYSHSVLQLKGGAKAADYQLFSSPFITERNRPEDIFSYFPSYDTSSWRFFSEDGGEYKEFGDIKSVKPGKGYWFLSRKDMKLFLSGKTKNVYEPTEIELDPGWNVIGSPFLFPVEWSEVLKHNENLSKQIGDAVWEFSDGGFQKSGMFKPFKGYYIFNGYGEKVYLLIPPIPVAPKAIAEVSANIGGTVSAKGPLTTQNGEGWFINIEADDSVYTDRFNLLGVAPLVDAENIAAVAEPPAWPQHLSFYFVKEGEPIENRRSTDIRSGEDKKEWTAYIEGGETGKVTLRWKGLAGDTGHLLLIDTVLNRSVDMTKAGSYTFTRNDFSPRRFTIR